MVVSRTFDEMLNLFDAVGKLKRIERTGWVRKAVSSPESVADHSFRVVWIGAYLGRQLGLDVEKIVELALVHDLAESHTGDRILGEAGLTRERKNEEEREALAQIVGSGEAGMRWRSLFEEWVAGETAEARLVAQVDRLEMGLTSIDYESAQGIDLKEFRRSAREALDPEGELMRLLERAEGRL